MNVIEINNPSQNIVSNSFIEATLREGIEKLNKESIKGYNLEYRNAEKTTDVLSFCYEKTKTEIIGEMLLCLDVISEYAIEDGSDVLSEFRKNIIHSLLHIIGLEHGSKMFDLQDKLLEEINE